MIYYWDTVLKQYSDGFVIIEADSVEEARNKIIANIIGEHDFNDDMKVMKAVANDFNDGVVDIYKDDIEKILKTEPKILIKGEILAIQGSA